MQTVRIVVIRAIDKSSLLPEGCDWTTVSPGSAVQMGIHFGLLRLITKMSVLPVKQAVPLLPWPLALAYLLLRFSIEATSVFEKGGSCRLVSCLVPSSSTVSSLLAARCLPVPWAAVMEVHSVVAALVCENFSWIWVVFFQDFLFSPCNPLRGRCECEVDEACNYWPFARNLPSGS